MTGYASRGPAGKREDERIRTAPGAVERKKIFVDQLIANEVEVPAADPHWHEVARMFYESCVGSAQSVYYEQSDWASLYLICEAMSRELADQVTAVIPATVNPETGEILVEQKVLWGKVPIKGASLNALKSMMTNLLITEVDRRRAGIEVIRTIQNEDVTKAEDAETVTPEERRLKLVGNA